MLIIIYFFILEKPSMLFTKGVIKKVFRINITSQLCYELYKIVKQSWLIYLIYYYFQVIINK